MVVAAARLGAWVLRGVVRWMHLARYREDVIVHFMRSRDVDPAGRRITMDNIASTAAFLQSKGIAHRTVSLTVGSTP